MKLVLSIIAVMFIVNVSAQTKKVLAIDSFPILTTDTALNNFVYYWLGKPYKLGGRTEKGIDCSGFNKRLYTDVYK